MFLFRDYNRNKKKIQQITFNLTDTLKHYVLKAKFTLLVTQSGDGLQEHQKRGEF
jgi:hypothetical protein